jgi:hypothetical protein
MTNDNENPMEPNIPNEDEKPFTHVDKLKACTLLTAALYDGTRMLEMLLTAENVMTNALEEPKDSLWQLGKLLVGLIRKLEAEGDTEESPKENVEKSETSPTNFAAEAGEQPSQDEVNAEIARIERLAKIAG